MSSTSSTYGPSTAPVSRFRVLWMPIPESAYEANTLGMIRNARTKRPLTPFSDRDGYLLVEILQARRHGLHYVHRLVLLAFAGDPPTLRHQAAHADGCRQHNAVWNLRWATPRENAADRRRHLAFRQATVSARRQPSQRPPPHRRPHMACCPMTRPPMQFSPVRRGDPQGAEMCGIIDAAQPGRSVAGGFRCEHAASALY